MIEFTTENIPAQKRLKMADHIHNKAVSLMINSMILSGSI